MLLHLNKPARILPDNIERTVFRTIINDDDLSVFIVDRKDGLQALSDGLAAVVIGDDD
jgi:hypothetical protein